MILFYELWIGVYALLLSVFAGAALLGLIIQDRLTLARFWQIAQYELLGLGVAVLTVAVYTELIFSGAAGWFLALALALASCMLCFLYMSRLWRMV